MRETVVSAVTVCVEVLESAMHRLSSAERTMRGRIVDWSLVGRSITEAIVRTHKVGIPSVLVLKRAVVDNNGNDCTINDLEFERKKESRSIAVVKQTARCDY